MENLKIIAKTTLVFILLILSVGIYTILYSLQSRQKNLYDKVVGIYNKETEQISYLAKNNYEDLRNQIAQLKSMSVEPYYLIYQKGGLDLMKFDYESKQGIAVFPNIEAEIRKFDGIAAGVGNKAVKLIGVVDYNNVILELTYYDTEWSKSILYSVKPDNKTIAIIGEVAGD